MVLGSKLSFEICFFSLDISFAFVWLFTWKCYRGLTVFAIVNTRNKYGCYIDYAFDGGKTVSVTMRLLLFWRFASFRKVKVSAMYSLRTTLITTVHKPSKTNINLTYGTLVYDVPLCPETIMWQRPPQLHWMWNSMLLRISCMFRHKKFIAPCIRA